MISPRDQKEKRKLRKNKNVRTVRRSNKPNVSKQCSPAERDVEGQKLNSNVSNVKEAKGSRTSLEKGAKTSRVNRRSRTRLFRDDEKSILRMKTKSGSSKELVSNA